MKTKARIVALGLAALMVFSVLAGLMGVIGYAASGDPSITDDSVTIYYKGYSFKENWEVNDGNLISGNAYDVEFEYTQEIDGLKTETITLDKKDFTLSRAFVTTGSTILKLDITYNNGTATVVVRLENVTYKGSKNVNNISLSFDTTINGTKYNYSVSPTVPSKYTTKSSGGSSGDDDDYTSNITVENVYITDAEGVRIDKVDKDTPAFNIVVVYHDRGLQEVDTDQFDSRSLEVYLTEPGGFVPGSGNTGTLRYVSDTSNGYPRFRAEFRNMTYNGGSNTITFETAYDVYGYIVEGGNNATVSSASNEEKDKLDPLTPHIIVNEYSYGQGQIAAGQEFTLNLSIKNTSAEIPLENIIMTITPQTIAETTSGSTNGGLTITSSSNTFYMETLGVGESQSHTINLRAEPNAAVGSHKVEITFKFQYVDDVNSARKDSTDEESIAIPVTQIDRFSVDPLTEYPEYMTAGDRGYLTLTFVNRGKSTTYNISATLQGEGITGQNQHYGNLEAGKSAYLDFEIYCYEPGEVNAEIVLEYEDENANQNQVVVPFTIQVEEPYYPPMDDYDPEDDYVEEEPKTSKATYALCGTGGFLIAVPIVLYMHKRVKAKGIEELDEDF